MAGSAAPVVKDELISLTSHTQWTKGRLHSAFPTTPAEVSSVEDLFEFICSGPLISKLGLSPEKIGDSIDKGKGGISPLFHGVTFDDSGSGSSGLDEEEALSGRRKDVIDIGGIGHLFDGVDSGSSPSSTGCGSGLDEVEDLSGRGIVYRPPFKLRDPDSAGSGSGSGSCIDEVESLPGTGSDDESLSDMEDDMERGLFCRGRDGIHGDFVPLSGDTRPEVLQRYVPKSVKEAFDRYSEVVVRSQGFDCDPNLYNALPSYLKDSYYTQPVDIRDPQHFASLRSCAHFAIGKYNRQEQTNLEFESIVKSTMIDLSGMLQNLIYSITLRAKNIMSRELKIYRAKVVL
ncbi:hypothetical protein Tsubulata_035191 [Turnera subulata]|uniref:Uncharacterized protein n=1 Tax=Turnera subulata TaxID=218843 RepID=A0A9Q0FJQ0_9ROSI|nr:hypothetical protein Tsubulata_035191 [Turnera subulata]